MNYIGNYKNWIKQEYIDFMLSTDGTPRPSGGRNPDSEEFRKAKEHGYDLSQTYWYIYESDTFPFEIKLPFNSNLDSMWWGIKMKPGNFMPVHRDPHTYDPALYQVDRYWMALQDWKPGHIFMYDRQVLVDYKAGDVFHYPDAQEIHCACNIGNSVRLTFHFSTYIKKTS
jgi:hypothetical protein